MSNVRDFGAVGNGKTDDTEAIRHAIFDGDGLIEFPRGEYLISETLEIPLERTGYIALEGSGGTAKIIMAAAGPAIRLVGTHLRGAAHPSDIQPRVWKSQRMPIVRHLEITATHPEADGIDLVGTMQATIEGVLLHRLRHGIRVRERNRNIIIDSSHIYHNTGIGVYLDGVNLHQINIVGNHISYNRLGGVRIERSEIRNLQITGNDIEYNNHLRHEGVSPEPTAEIFIDTCAPGATVDEVTIASNTIQATPSPGGANIRILDNGDKDRPPGLYAITGNIIGSQEVNLHLVGCYGPVISGNAVYSATQLSVLAENCDQLNFTGNNFRRHSDDRFAGMKLDHCRNSILSGCHFRDETPGGQNFPLLEMDACERISIVGCQFLDGTPVAIDANDCQGIQLVGCTIARSEGEPNEQLAVRFRGTSNNNAIAACHVDGKVEMP
jgi:hypothetical protein